MTRLLCVGFLGVHDPPARARDAYSNSRTNWFTLALLRVDAHKHTMAKAEHQRNWRARDHKKTIQVRLCSEALSRLDNFTARIGARGRAEVIERLLLADPGDHPEALFNEAIRLGRAALLATGQTEAALRDTGGAVFVLRRE